jgi:hypothetical protein
MKHHPQAHIQGIRSSRMVDNHWIPYPSAKTDLKNNGTYANKFAEVWRRTPKILIGVQDLRARRGTFNTPWNAPSNPLYAMPELKFINDTLSDLMDERAMELYNEAKNSNKKLAVMWSGGIDSTAVLTSLLKNIPNNEHDMIEVIMTTSSIYENVEYWKKYINGKIKQSFYLDISLNTHFLDKYILLHGDPGDCLFGPSMPMYKDYFLKGLHKQPHSIYKIKIKNYLTDDLAVDFNQWYYDKISQSIGEIEQQDYVSTVADFWWWTYFNFKWEFSCQRPFFYMRATSDKDGMLLYKKPISYEHQQRFAKNTFFNTDKFQQWSYTNLKRLIPDNDQSQHKIDVKRYVYEFDHNEIYFVEKPKVGVKNPTQHIDIDRPVYYDNNWIGYSGNEDNSTVDKSMRYLIERYEG